MKKYFLIAAAACVALAACTKNEVKPVEVEQEITYQTIDTKAASSFLTSNKFYSWAYLLASDKNWDADYASATKYIDNVLISYNSTANGWKNESTAYYWPKKAKLTFFSWSDATADPKVTSPATVACNQDTGVIIDNYSAFTDKNKDLLVAMIAANQNGNTSTTSWSAGVPTVFYHVLSALDIKAKTNMSTSDFTFKVKSVTFSGVLSKGKYTQGYTSTATPIAVTWSGVSDANNYDVYAPSGLSEALSATEKLLEATNGEYTIFMPQTLPDDAKVTIVYQVTYGTTDITDEVSVEKNLKDIFTEWKPGYKYTLKITIGLDEILWDPDIQAWETGTGNVTI